MRIRSTYASMVLAAAAAVGLALAGSAWADDREAAGSAGDTGQSMDDTSRDALPGESGPAGSSGNPGESLDDKSRDTVPGESSPLARQVRQELEKHEGLKEVRVQSEGRSEVTLEGSVSSSTEREEAARVARNVPGVQKVENRIRIGGSGASDVSSPPPQEGE